MGTLSTKGEETSRLIDTEEFIKRIDHYPPDIRDTAKKELRYCKTVDAVPVSTIEQIKWERDSLAEQIREIGGEPFAKWDAVDVVKVKHGHWIDMGDFEQCSTCKATHLKEFNSFYGKVTWIRTEYCPHCGAKMDESTQSNDSNTLDALGEKVTE